MGYFTNVTREVLKPTKTKLVFFILYAFLWIAGVTQTYAFIDDVPGLAKPPLYDYLRPFSFWFAWLVFSAPFYIITSLLCIPYDFCTAVLSNFPNMGAVKLPLAGIIYTYFAAAFTICSWNNYVAKSNKEKQVLLISLIFTLILVGPIAAIIFIEPSRLLFILSSYATMYLVMFFYVTSTYGVYRIIKNRASQPVS